MNEEEAKKQALSELDGEENITDAEKQGLSDLEKASNTPISSLGKVERLDYAKDEIAEVNRTHGNFSLDVKDFPSGGKFYGIGLKVRIKAASVNDIRNFSALDEENPFEVDEALVDLLASCVKVTYGTRVGSWKDLLEEDRLFVILSIRELTFADGENVISFKVKCESCGTENDMAITNENFQKRDIDPKIAKYYDHDTKSFQIKTKTYSTIVIKPPTIGIMRVVNRYIKELQEKKENVKEYLPFLKTVPYLVNEWRGFGIKDMDSLRMEFLRWDKNKFLTYTQLTELAQVSVKEQMSKPCDKCFDPIEAEIQLPTGIKGLFIESGILDNELM